MPQTLQRRVARIDIHQVKLALKMKLHQSPFHVHMNALLMPVGFQHAASESQTTEQSRSCAT